MINLPEWNYAPSRFLNVIRCYFILPVFICFLSYLFPTTLVFANDGYFARAKSIGGGGDDSSKGISVDDSGNIYTIGNFYGTVDFDPGSGSFYLTSHGGSDIFISKLDSNGNFVWAKSMGGVSNDSGLGISIDNSGNIYTIGSFTGTVDFDPDLGGFNLTGGGVFFGKLDSYGNFLWAKALKADDGATFRKKRQCLG